MFKIPGSIMGFYFWQRFSIVHLCGLIPGNNVGCTEVPSNYQLFESKFPRICSISAEIPSLSRLGT